MDNIAEASSRVVRSSTTRRGALLGAVAAAGGVAGGGLALAMAEKPSLDGYFNVKDYGAIGDDDGDDASAFQAAIDAAATSREGGIVYVPATSAAYRISQIRMKSNVWLTGQGVRSTLRSVNSSANAYMIILDDATVTDTWISGLHLACTEADDSDAGCLLYDHTDQSGDRRHRFSDLYVTGFHGDGFHFSGAVRAMFLSNIYFGTNAGNGRFERGRDRQLDRFRPGRKLRVLPGSWTMLPTTATSAARSFSRAGLRQLPGSATR